MGYNFPTELGSPPWQLDLLQFSPLSALLLLRLAWGTMAQELPITAMELPAMSPEAPRVLARGLLSPAMATTMDLELPITAMELLAMLPEALKVLARGLLSPAMATTMDLESPITAMELPAMLPEALNVLARGLLSPAMATNMDLESPITAMELPAMSPEVLRVLARGLQILSHLTMALAHLLMSQDRTTPMDMVSITMESDQLNPPIMAAMRTATSMYPGLTLLTALVYIMDKFQSKNEIHC